MKIKVNKEGVTTIREFAEAMPLATENIKNYTESLEKIYDSIADDLGEHEENFRELLSSVKRAQQQSTEAILFLSTKLNDTADKMEHYINNPPSKTIIGDTIYSKNSSGSANQSSYSDSYMQMKTMLEKKNVTYNPINKHMQERSADEIISYLGGGDKTKGSCSSLAFAYAGNKAGYDVLDFRGGESMKFFSRNSSISMVAGLSGVNSRIEYGLDDIECADRLLSEIVPGKEYYLATGEHAAIVRLNNGHYEYLELQSEVDNGWHILHDQRLYDRFGCGTNKVEYPNYLIEIDSLAECKEFLDILGFINTSDSEQLKGTLGYAK